MNLTSRNMELGDGGITGSDDSFSRGQWIRQIAEVCEKAASGDLEPRLLHCPKSPELARAVRSINHLLDMTDALLRETGAALDHAARKKFYRRVLVRGMRGAFRRSAEQINKTTQQLAEDGLQLATADASRRTLSGQVNGVVQGLSTTASRMDITATVLTEMAQGSGTKDDGLAKGKNAIGRQNLQQAVAALNDASQRMGGVVDLITDIAERTNLLALNAAIEGARAGDAGRGFSVVASEVKKLSEQTANATSEISKEIASVRTTAGLTAQLVTSLSQTIGELKEVSKVLNQQSDELAKSMSSFLRNEAT